MDFKFIFECKQKKSNHHLLCIWYSVCMTDEKEKYKWHIFWLNAVAPFVLTIIMLFSSGNGVHLR